MRILITGGCGFLGSHLVEHFLKASPTNDIVVLDKLTSASYGFDRLRDIADNWPGGGGDDVRRRVRVLGGVDLAQPITDGVAQEIGPVDYIIHAAAESHVDNSIVDPLPFLQSNVIGTHHLLMFVRDLMSRYRVVAGKREYAAFKRVFVISTDEVYGPAPWPHPAEGTTDLRMHENHGMDPVTGAFGEDSRFRPANPYAAAKAGQEAVAMAYANTYKLPITIVNTMNLIGERQHPEKFVPLVIRKVLAGETVTIHADPTRTRSGTRFYLHCRTLANALGWLIEQDLGRWTISKVEGAAADHGMAVGGVLHRGLPLKIHVCGEREISNLELAQMIAGIIRTALKDSTGLDLDVMRRATELKYELVDFHSSRPGHDLRYAMDDSLISSMGWVRPMNLEQSLEKTVRWYLANPKYIELPTKKGEPR
jgi:dTDP-D-glucose 4,6-dehydratase